MKILILRIEVEIAGYELLSGEVLFEVLTSREREGDENEGDTQAQRQRKREKGREE